MKLIKKTNFNQAYFLAIAFFISGCGGGSKDLERGEYVLKPSQAESSEKKVILGLQIPLTGPYASIGLQAQAGVAAAVAEANANAPTLDGKKIKFVVSVEDDQGQADAARLAATHLSLEKPIGVVGPITDEAGLASLPIYAKANIAVISPTIGDPEFSKPSGYANAMSLAPSYDQQAKAMLEFAAKQLGTAQWHLITDNSSAGQALGAALAAHMRNTSKAKINEESINFNTLNSTALAKSIQQSKAQVVLFAGQPEAAGKIAQALAEAKLPTPIVGGSAIMQPDFFRFYKTHKTTHYAVSFAANIKEGSYAGLEKKLGDKGMTLVQDHAYVAAAMLLSSWKSTPSLQGAGIIDRLHSDEGLAGLKSRTQMLLRFSMSKSTDGSWRSF
jgi:branched-chain amino acid transport system substrate-binding protein